MSAVDVTVPPPSSATRTAGSQAAVVVDKVVADVAFEGERAFSRVRVGIALAATLLWPLIVMFGDPAALVAVEIVCVAALLVSVIMWAVVRRRERTSPLFGLASVLIDVGIAGGLGVAVVLSPPADFIGIMHVTGFAMIYIAVAGAGVRLSRRAGIAGAVTAVVVMFAVHLLDRALNPTLTVDNAVHLALGVILIAAAMLVALASAQRTREVALSVARQTLLFERARHTLGAYVSSEVAEHAMRSESVSLGGVRQRVAILFTDLRGFTSLSEHSDPEALVRELNEYFDHMVRAVREHGGVVDKYIGDSIMAVFGAPTPRDDDAARAIRAAASMQRALDELNASRGRRGLAPLAHGIGVHIGDVVAGNIGTADRTQYTVIGDAVNVAARLESATKDQKVQVLISQDAVAAAVAAPGSGALPGLREVGGITVKGRGAAITVSTLA